MAMLSIMKTIPKGRSKAEDISRSLGIAEDELNELQLVERLLDPYAGFSWSGNSLRTLIQALNVRLERIGEDVEKSILNEVKQEALQDWMLALIKVRLSTNPSRRALLRLREFAQLAETEQCLLVFDGD